MRQTDSLLALFVLVAPTLLAYAVLPFGRNLVPIRPGRGHPLFFAVGASTELSVFMAGWSSRNKYSLLGAMRAIAQMISYEIPLIISSVTVIMLGVAVPRQSSPNRTAIPFRLVPHWNVSTLGFAASSFS